MSETDLGYVDLNDPLYAYLRDVIQPQVSDFVDWPSYRVRSLNASNAVYLYEEESTGAKIIGKYFYSDNNKDKNDADNRLEREFSNMENIRGYGFDSPPFYVARPLGKNFDLNDLLTVEFCDGELFGSLIVRTLNERDEVLLKAALGALARFFAACHNRTATDISVDFEKASAYASRVMRQCALMLEEDDETMLQNALDHWHDMPEMWEDCQVFVHGDATPANFMFAGDGCVKTFDLERGMLSDRVFDIGRMCGELAHFFMTYAGDKTAAEPFIDYFLHEYATCFPDAEAAFNAVTKRVPFYMGVTLLRIARNFWLDEEVRRRLVVEAEKCLAPQEE